MLRSEKERSENEAGPVTMITTKTNRIVEAGSSAERMALLQNSIECSGLVHSAGKAIALKVDAHCGSQALMPGISSE